MKELTIYEAGKMSGLDLQQMLTWRIELTKELEDIAEMVGVKVNAVNPVNYFNFVQKRNQTESEIMKFDLSKVKQSDIVIVNMDGLNTSIGTCIELYEAYKREIPVLAFGSNKLYEELHPWVQCCITRHDETYKETVNYIKEFYMT